MSYIWQRVTSTIVTAPFNNAQTLSMYNLRSYAVAARTYLNRLTYLQCRGWVPKFATGLNIIIGIVQKVYEWSNCPFAKMIPKWENHFGKTTAWSLIYFFIYSLLWYLAQSQTLGLTLYVINILRYKYSFWIRIEIKPINRWYLQILLEFFTILVQLRLL